MEERIESYNHIAMNTGNTPTFVNANGSSIIDVTMATTTISMEMTDWQVDKRYENLIMFQTKPPGDNTRKQNPKKGRNPVEAQELIQLITRKCNENLKKRHSAPTHFLVDWQNRRNKTTMHKILKIK